MKTISIPVNNRPNHLNRVLQSVESATGSQEWKYCLSCEPAIFPTIIDVRGFVSSNTVQKGCWTNTFLAADFAMSKGSELNLYLEDDYLITPDTLTMIEQWDASGKEGALCLRRAHEHQDLNRPSDVCLSQIGLFGCGFAWRASVWPLIREAWFCRDAKNDYRMWDHSIEHGLRDFPQWRPMINRSFGIGLTGTHSYGDGKDLNLFGPAYTGAPISKFNFME